MTDFILKLFIKNYKDTNDKTVRRSVGTLAGVVGILCNVLLCAVKIAIGLISKSISIVADGLNNLSDTGSSVITIIGFKLSGKPADRDHPYGHGRMEYMSAFTVSVLIIIVGFELFTSSLKALINGENAPVFGTFSLVALAMSVVVKVWMFAFNRRLGKMINAEGLMATARDSINDAVTTFAVFMSAILTKVFDFGFNLDAIMALVVALYIVWAGIGSAKNTLSDILGKAPDKELIDDIQSIVMSFSDFAGIHDLIVHDYGPGRVFASLHVEVPQTVDIVECHEKVDLCEKVVFERTGVELVIHTDPIDTDDETVGKTKNDMIEIIKEIDPRFTLHDFRMTPVSNERTNLIFDIVLPSDFNGSVDELRNNVEERARRINSTFTLVITFDRDFTGKN